MRFTSYLDGGKARFGLVADDGIVDLTGALDGRFASLKAAIAADALAELAGWASGRPADLALEDAHLTNVIPDAERIFCFGLNYRKRSPAGGDVTEMANPNFFLRAHASLVGHGQDIVKPRVSDAYDYEGEIGVIIGKPGRHIAEDDALSHVAGYTCLDEGSVRDWQRHSVAAGKNFEASGSCGPWMVTADEIGDPAALRVISRVNGEVRQDESAAMMFFSIPQQIAYLSRIMELHPGDILSTGSPEGSGGQRTPPIFLKAGDMLEVEVPGVGTLRNRVVAE